MNTADLKFPIGECKAHKNPNSEELRNYMNDLEQFPALINEVCEGLNLEEKGYRYRPEGWMLKQVVHHCADSHMNALIRFKLALTEQNPIIKPYEEAEWAELKDSLNDELDTSLMMLKGIHARWLILIKSLKEQDLEREYIHPAHGKKFNLKEVIGTYAWHSNHHLAHIKNALKFKF